MNTIEEKLKKWIELIQAEKLNGVTEDIQTNIPVNNEKLNKHLFKLLLYLSHTADKCDKQNHATGKEIYKLTSTLCSLLLDIPDNIKFVSSLFHIIRCLLAMYMFNEASKVCFYLKTDALSSHESANDILVKITYLWHNAVSNEFNLLQKDPSNSKYYSLLKNIIKYELKVIEITYKNYTKHLLTKISSYLDKIALINNESNFSDFSTFVIEYLSQTKILLSEGEKYIICRYILHISSRIICENINEKHFKFAIQTLNTLSSYFREILEKDEESYRCFTLFESLCLTLAKPVKSLVGNNTKTVQELTDNYIRLTQKYGYTGCVKWTTFSIVLILESLFMYWETTIETEKKMYLQNDLLLETMNLVGYISICFIKQTSDKCKSCQSEDCMIKKDMYNAVAIKTRCVNLISKLSTNDLSKDIYILVRRFLEKNIAHIYEMKECRCKCWTHLWCTSSALIYNLGIMSESFYEESISLFSLLFTSIIHFEGIQSKSRYINLQNPTSFILHRISSLHYNHGMYREAMTATALHALLSYQDSESKAFRMWANIKHKFVSSKEVMEMTILACIKRDKRKIEEMGLSIELSKYNLLELCLREAKSLQEAKVNLSTAILKVLSEMRVLKATPLQYARAVQMLAYHLLHFDHNEDISECLKEAISTLKQIKTDSSVLCLQANLEFQIFVMQLHAINKKTQMEMENTKFALYAPKINEIGENESRDMVPAYTMINIKEDSRLMIYLQVALKKWNKCFKQNLKEIAKEHEAMITLHTLIVAGEYAHLYRYQECELNIWKLVFALASELQDNSTIIYVTGRCISLRHINQDWITTAKDLAIKQKDTTDETIICAIAIFWISLSDFYFEHDEYDEARKLLNGSRKLPGISFFSNIAVHLYSLDRILYNCYLYKETIKHEEYTRYIVETLYTLVNLNEELSARKWKPQDKCLFGFDILLSATVNLSLRMNSLLSFREIGAHLVRRLKTAQTLGATIRVAEILKCLCYIDLSRAQLSDCEVKLQGLEHILNIESFKASMNSNFTKKMNMENVLLTPIRVVDPIRDVPQNDTSPVLRNKVFDLPEFMCHKECNCYVCKNVSYHYLVFTSTHIRAQLYALQKNIAASLQHFHGAFKIKEKLTKTTKNDEYMSWEERFYSIDYVLLLVNFSYFLRNYLNTREEQIMSMILLVVRMCDVYKLKGHPIYMTCRELMLNYQFQKIFNSSDYSKLTVPDTSDINTSKYAPESNVEESICVTPTINNVRVKKPITLRRNRTPPLLKLTKVSMNFSDDEDNTFSPPAGYRKTRSRSKLTRRKILDEEYSDAVNERKGESKSSMSLEKKLSDSLEEENRSTSIKDVINKIALLAPDISEHLSTIHTVDEPATTRNVQKLVDTIESLKISTSQKNTSKTRHSKQSTSSDSNQINQVIALFKDFGISEKNVDLQNDKNDVKCERKESVEMETLSCQKQSKMSEEKTQKIEQNNIDSLKKTSANENTRQRITRNSVKHSVVINKETYNVKTRKSKEKV